MVVPLRGGHCPVPVAGGGASIGMIAASPRHRARWPRGVVTPMNMTNRPPDPVAAEAAARSPQRPRGDRDHDGPAPIPPDDLSRDLAIRRPDDPDRPHYGVVGDNYTILLTGEDTAGRYGLIDMFVPPEGGPPPHRHDFEEMFHVLEGEFEVTFRGHTCTIRAGETINIPARAPHRFRNAGERSARVLCMVSPAGLEEYFGLWGQPLSERTEVPQQSEEERAGAMADAVGLGPRFRIENLSTTRSP